MMLSAIVPPHTGLLLGCQRGQRSTPDNCQTLSNNTRPTQMEQISRREPSWQLSTELLIYIFQQLRELDQQSLFVVRLVSRRFDRIAIPILYASLKLNKRLVQPDAVSLYPHIFRLIAAHAKHLTVPSNLDPRGIRRILLLAERLVTVRWCNANDDEQGQTGFWLPSNDIQAPMVSGGSGVDLEVEGFPLEGAETNSLGLYQGAIPPMCLTSLKLSSPATPLTTQLGALKGLVLQARRLKILHYRDRGQGTCFRFEQGERMPSLRSIVLESYDWCHSSKQVESHWDFSQAQSLSLISVPIFNFLISVNFNSLTNLQDFRVDDYSAHLPDRRREATEGLAILIHQYVRRLVSLSMTCQITHFPIDSILKHRGSLQVLRLRDHVGFGDEGKVCPTLHHSLLWRMAEEMKYVHTLELDMDPRAVDVFEFLQALLRFRSLRTLIIHTQTHILPLAEDYTSRDIDYEACIAIFRHLWRSRQESDLACSPWKSITINVGGWRQVLIRRLGAAWKERNERGIFGERCFVLKNGAHGGFDLTEQSCVDCRSGRTNIGAGDYRAL